MNINDLPTKKNLLAAKQNLNLAKKGHELLEIKYNALFREFKRFEKIAHEMTIRLHEMTNKRKYVLTIAKMETGIEISEDNPLHNLKETCAATDESFFLQKEICNNNFELNQEKG
jgi:vacuolar-type H+-ATPase subunit D/Vma8